MRRRVVSQRTDTFSKPWANSINARARRFVSLEHPELAAEVEKWAWTKGRNQIYALADPVDMRVRYIGKTTSLERRLLRHLEQPHCNPALRAWLGGLSAHPEIVTLQICAEVDWERCEQRWILWFRMRGDLMNIEDGGRTEPHTFLTLPRDMPLKRKLRLLAARAKRERNMPR